MTEPTWTDVRPWRNANPGDLRVLPGSDMWEGQVDIDYAPGGPFAIFKHRIYGWRALAKCLIAYKDLHGLDTVRGIVDRYAPPVENDTTSYADFVCGRMGVKPDDVVDVRDPKTLDALCSAIAVMEGGARIPWPAGERAEGVKMALGGV